MFRKFARARFFRYVAKEEETTLVQFLAEPHFRGGKKLKLSR